jgi:hypothetical protein
MARYRKKSYFSAGDCNTICDRTGFKVKLSETVTTWDGFRVIPEANSIRNPQDFAPTIIKPAVHKESRSESYYDTSTITPPDPV